MIPEFNDNGCLPSGVHRATLDEVAERFGQGSELREAEMDSIRWLVEASRRAEIQRIILNGSFVTDVAEPNDVDCALLAGPDYPVAEDAAVELEGGLPFLDIHVVAVDDFKFFVETLFSSDRKWMPKGMIEVIL